MPRVLGRLPYGPDTVPVRSFNYVEQVKGPDHEKYLWTSAAFSFASNMVKSFVNNGWCVQIRGPQAGGAVKDLPIHLYDLGTGNQVKIPSEVMIPETREFEFASLGFIPLSYYKNRDYACFFSANSAQKPALYDTADATANSRINARLPYIFLLSRIAHYPVVPSIPICWSCCVSILATAVTPDCASPYPCGCCLSPALAQAGVSSWAVPVCWV